MTQLIIFVLTMVAVFGGVVAFEALCEFVAPRKVN